MLEHHGFGQAFLSRPFRERSQTSLQAKAMREHPRNLSDALIAARMAHRQLSIFGPPAGDV